MAARNFGGVIGADCSAGDETVVTYKMRGIVAGAYSYWTTTDVNTNRPVGATEVTIAGLLIDEVH